MPMLKDDYQKTEKINGIIYNMSPAANYRHGIVNGNIYGKVREGLKDSLCLVFMENLDYKYHPEVNDDPIQRPIFNFIVLTNLTSTSGAYILAL